MYTKMICAIAVLVLLACPALAHAILWDFNTEGDTEGWLAYGSAFAGGGNLRDLRVEDGMLKIIRVQVPEIGDMPPSAVLLSPVLNVDTELLDRIRVRVKRPEGQGLMKVSIMWRTSEAPTSLEPEIFAKYSLKWPWWIALSPEWEEIAIGRLNELETWTGQLVQFELYFNFGPPGWQAQEVCTLVNAPMPAGHYTIPWDGRNAWGHPAASGRYLIRLQTDEFRQSRIITLIK